MNKRMVIGLLGLSLLLTGMVANAHRGWHGGPSWGGGGGYYAPYWGPYYDPYWDPYYAIPAPVVVQPQPNVVYIERPAPQPAASGRYWCASSHPSGYYPQVPACPGGWIDTQNSRSAPQ